MLYKERLIALAAALALAGCGNDEERTTPAPSSAPDAAAVTDSTVAANEKAVAEKESAEEAEAAVTINDVDREFATGAFGTNIAHVQAARLAAEKTLDEDVRRFAQEIQKDHTAANEELMKLAQSMKIDLPTAPLAVYKEDLQRLTMVTGPQHDRFYMDRFGITAHEQTLALYEREIREGEDGELKRFAERRVPLLREHLERAKTVRQNVDSTR